MIEKMFPAKSKVQISNPSFNDLMTPLILEEYYDRALGKTFLWNGKRWMEKIDNVPHGKVEKEERLYIIVKYADENCWPTRWEHDPKVTGVGLQFSAFYSYSGQIADIKMFYSDLNEAQQALLRIQKVNPSVGYDICPVNDHEIDKLLGDSKSL